MRRYRVLVADDMPFNLAIIQRMLEQMGHDVTAVVDGEEAVDYASSSDYDVILLDLSMPVVDGNLAAQRIRALPNANAHVPILAVTAGENACTASFSGVVRKPLNRDRLARAFEGLGGTHSVYRDASDAAPVAADQACDALTVDRCIALEALELLNPKARGAMIARFESECGRLCHEIEGAIEQGKDAVARARSHSLAGLMGQFGLVGASKVALQVARSHDPQACFAHAKALVPLVARNLIQFRDLVASPEYCSVA